MPVVGRSRSSITKIHRVNITAAIERRKTFFSLLCLGSDGVYEPGTEGPFRGSKTWRMMTGCTTH